MTNGTEPKALDILRPGFGTATKCDTRHGHPLPPIDTGGASVAHSRITSGPALPLTTTLVKILTFEYRLPRPYHVGHVCTEAEGEALNNLLIKGLSKGLYKVLAQGIARSGFSEPRILSADARKDIQEQGEEYIYDFSLGFAQGHDFTRALRIEAERIARSTLEAQLYKQGKSLKDISEGERDERIKWLAEGETVKTEALRRVKVTQEIASRAHIELLGEQSEGSN